MMIHRYPRTSSTTSRLSQHRSPCRDRSQCTPWRIQAKISTRNSSRMCLMCAATPSMTQSTGILVIFRKHHRKVTSKQGKKIKVLQNNVSIFGQLYISMQNREGDLAEFFSHEIQSFPPSLSDFGKVHLPNTKPGLLQCLEQPGKSDPPSTYDCKVMDGAIIVHFLPTTRVSTFDEYADIVFIPYLEKQLQTATRLDVVWDTYISDSFTQR